MDTSIGQAHAADHLLPGTTRVGETEVISGSKLEPGDIFRIPATNAWTRYRRNDATGHPPVIGLVERVTVIVPTDWTSHYPAPITAAKFQARNDWNPFPHFVLLPALDKAADVALEALDRLAHAWDALRGRWT